jgi:hypothetical protein
MRPENQSHSTAGNMPGKIRVNLSLLAMIFPALAMVKEQRIRRAKGGEWPPCDGPRKDCS